MNKFELYEDRAGKFRFRLKDGRGEVIVVGAAYETKAAAQKGIESVRRNAADAKLDDQTDNAGEDLPGLKFELV